MTNGLQTKCKTCFGGSRMILHALWKKHFFQKAVCFFHYPCQPPPGLARDHKKYGFFFGPLPLEIAAHFATNGRRKKMLVLLVRTYGTFLLLACSLAVGANRAVPNSENVRRDVHWRQRGGDGSVPWSHCSPWPPKVSGLWLPRDGEILKHRSNLFLW